jgi:hypothetical protein
MFELQSGDENFEVRKGNDGGENGKGKYSLSGVPHELQVTGQVS